MDSVSSLAFIVGLLFSVEPIEAGMDGQTKNHSAHPSTLPATGLHLWRQLSKPGFCIDLFFGLLFRARTDRIR